MEERKNRIDKAFSALVTPTAIIISAMIVLSVRSPLLTFLLPIWVISLHLVLVIFSALLWCIGVFEKKDESSLSFRVGGLIILVFSLTVAPTWVIILAIAEGRYPFPTLMIVGLAYYVIVTLLVKKLLKSIHSI